MLLQKAKAELAYAKVGILGFAGTGKSYTSALISIGLAQMIGSKQVAWQDTETGSDWLVGKYRDAGIDLLVAKTRAFNDTLMLGRECLDNGIKILIVDSITHVWRDEMESYLKKNNKKRMSFPDWAAVKKDWGVWTDFFITSPLHIIICGRAGYEYDFHEDEDGARELVKTGTKMKVEAEFGFEPSLVVEMERTTVDKDALTKLKKEAAKTKAGKDQRREFRPSIGSQWIHRAHILKDRADRLTGAMIDNPTFKDFLPHFESLNLGGSHFALDTSRDSTERFDQEGRPEWKQKKAAREIALEEIQNYLTEIWPSTSKDDKQYKNDWVELFSGRKSWTHVQENIPLEKLQWGTSVLAHFRNRWPEMCQDEEFMKLFSRQRLEKAWSTCISEEIAMKEAAKTKTPEQQPLILGADEETT